MADQIPTLHTALIPCFAILPGRSRCAVLTKLFRCTLSANTRYSNAYPPSYAIRRGPRHADVSQRLLRHPKQRFLLVSQQYEECKVGVRLGSESTVENYWCQFGRSWTRNDLLLLFQRAVYENTRTTFHSRFNLILSLTPLPPHFVPAPLFVVSAGGKDVVQESTE